MIDLLLDLVLLTFLVVSAVAIIRQRNLFAVIVLFGIFSLLSAGLFVVMDAADVAFTEAAVGAGVSTVLMLATLALTGGKDTELQPFHPPVLPLLVVLVTGAALIYGTWDIPGFGDPQAPVHAHVAPGYLTRGPVETGMPNVVTSVLASYRGFDTLGEVTVIFTAGIAVLLLLGGRPAKGSAEDEDDEDRV
jgi:multicomponent Na+:H+ antiporter subunit B